MKRATTTTTKSNSPIRGWVLGCFVSKATTQLPSGKEQHQQKQQEEQTFLSNSRIIFLKLQRRQTTTVKTASSFDYNYKGDMQ